jgi:hypothetical protein
VIVDGEPLEGIIAEIRALRAARDHTAISRKGGRNRQKTRREDKDDEPEWIIEGKRIAGRPAQTIRPSPAPPSPNASSMSARPWFPRLPSYGWCRGTSRDGRRPIWLRVGLRTNSPAFVLLPVQIHFRVSLFATWRYTVTAKS